MQSIIEREWLLSILFISTWIALISGAQGCFRSSVPAPVTRSKSDKIGVRGPWMVDSAGRIRIFHGFNAVRKSPPWYPDSLSDTDLQFYKEWGFNVIRLGAMWSGVNPSEGVINMTYVNVIKDMVRRAGNHGMYVLLDMHQDVISSRFKAYDGVPRWVIDKCPNSSHPYPWPLKNLNQWADGYLTDAVGNAFQCLYDNAAHSREYMANFWQTVAKNFKDLDNVLGYELINEPWAGDIYKDPSLLLPGNAGHRNLAPLYEVLNKAIREIDNETLVFYEPVTWGMVLPGTGALGNGFRSVPGGKPFVNKSVMSWHYYCWILAIDDKNPYGTFQRLICDGALGPRVFDTVHSDILRTGGSSFLTEFGLCEPDSNKNDTETIECDFVLSQADSHLQSWAYWDSQFFNPDGKVCEDVVRSFARVYATAIAGTPLKMKFDLSSRQFYLAYKADPNITAATKIQIPKLQYPNGFTVKLSSGIVSTYNQTDSTLSVWYKTDGNNRLRDNTAEVNIMPK